GHRRSDPSSSRRAFGTSTPARAQSRITEPDHGAGSRSRITEPDHGAGSRSRITELDPGAGSRRRVAAPGSGTGSGGGPLSAACSTRPAAGLFEQRDGSVALAGFGGSPAFPPEQAREALAGARLTAGGGAAPRLPRELRRFSALERLRE